MKIKLVKLYNLLSYYFTMTNKQEINNCKTIDELIVELKQIKDNENRR